MYQYSEKILTLARDVASKMQTSGENICKIPLSSDSHIWVSEDPALVIGAQYIELNDKKYWIGSKAA